MIITNSGPEAPILTDGEVTFRDLNKNDRLDLYEDPRRPIAEKSAALLADFGASDAAILDIIFGKFKPAGKLPFELPSSMEAVKKQKEDLPYDSQDPVFPFGHGLKY